MFSSHRFEHPKIGLLAFDSSGAEDNVEQRGGLEHCLFFPFIFPSIGNI